MLSPYLLAIILSWVVAQGAKYVLHAFKYRDAQSFRLLYASGSMPSVHTAAAVALLVVVAGRDGIGSGVFGLALLFVVIVMYDAVMVRRSAGEQGEAIQQLIKEQKSQVRLPRAAKGHTPLEVLVGAIVGAAIGWVVFIATI